MADLPVQTLNGNRRSRNRIHFERIRFYNALRNLLQSSIRNFFGFLLIRYPGDLVSFQANFHRDILRFPANPLPR